MKISVVTVAFNSARTIADTIRSVAEQTYTNVEHIVVDGGSTDGTLDIVEAIPNRVAHILCESDRGIYDAMNKGLSLATGDVVGFLNSDDFYSDQNCLSDIARVFEQPSVDACYGDVRFVAANDCGRVVREWRSGTYRVDRLLKGWMPPHPTFYARRSIYLRSGNFDLKYKLQSDYEMAVRLLKNGGLRLVYIPRMLVTMRMGGASNASIGNVVRGNIEAYRAARSHGLPVGPAFIVRKLLSRVPQFFVRRDKSAG